jgi:ribonuclease P/MRP protein subunit RPP1
MAIEKNIQFKTLKLDLVRFKPDPEKLRLLDYDSCIYFTKDPSEMEVDYAEHSEHSEHANYTNYAIFPAYLIECDDVTTLKRELRKAEKSWIIGVKSSEISVLREAISRKKVDILLDSVQNRIDYVALKLASEKDVAVELSFSKFLGVKGTKRMRLFEHAGDVISMAKKLSTPLVLSSAASNFFEMRSLRQIEDFFRFLGADFDSCLANVRKIIRRYFDDSYILDGLEYDSG